MKRMATRKLILTFLDEQVVRRKGKVVLAIALYAIFVSRTGAYTSAARFFRILRDDGYHMRPNIGGDYYENISIIH